VNHRRMVRLPGPGDKGSGQGPQRLVFRFFPGVAEGGVDRGLQVLVQDLIFTVIDVADGDDSATPGAPAEGVVSESNPP